MQGIETATSTALGLAGGVPATSLGITGAHTTIACHRRLLHQGKVEREVFVFNGLSAVEVVCVAAIEDA